MIPARSDHRSALGGLLLATLFWGVSFALNKSAVTIHEQLLPGGSGWFTTAMTVAPRFLLSAVVVALFAPRIVFAARRGEWQQGAYLGLTNGLGMFFQVDGLRFTSASVSGFLTQFSAILIPAVVALQLRRWPAPRVWACALLVLVGTGILGRFDLRTLHLGRGELETLVSSVFFMFQILALDDPRHAGNRVLAVSAVMFATEGVMFLGLALATAAQPGDLLVLAGSPGWLGFTGALTVFCTLGAFLLMVRWQPGVTATEAGLIYCVESVFAAIFALFVPGLLSRWFGFDYPNESVTWQLLVGGGLITMANVVLQLQSPVRSSPPIRSGEAD